MNSIGIYIVGVATPFFFGGIGLSLWLHSATPLIGTIIGMVLIASASNFQD